MKNGKRTEKGERCKQCKKNIIYDIKDKYCTKENIPYNQDVIRNGIFLIIYHYVLLYISILIFIMK